MTDKEFSIVKQFIQALIDNAYTRCTVKIGGENCGCMTIEDANSLLKRIHILVDEEERE